MYVNCPFLEKRQNRFYPTIDHILPLISPPHGMMTLLHNEDATFLDLVYVNNRTIKEL